MRSRGLFVWIIPAGLAAIAGVLGYRYLRDADGTERPSPNDPPPQAHTQCPSQVVRCVKGEVRLQSGDQDAEGKCLETKIGACSAACVAEGLPLERVDDSLARAQLCDPPADVEALVAKEETITELLDDGGVCEADGFGPDGDGIVECILRSTKDPDALGIIVRRIHCKKGPVATFDRRPRTISRERAIALYCLRL